MKKLVFGALSMFLLSATLISCGGGMTDEEIAKKAEEKLKSEEATLLEEATKKCDAERTRLVDSLKQANATTEEGDKHEGGH